MSASVYLDYNATAPLRPIAAQAMLDAHKAPYNASAVHSFGRQGRKYVEDARAALSGAINCSAQQIVFNSGATEGNNTVLQHFASVYPDDVMFVTATEHPSARDVLPNAQPLPVNAHGIVDAALLADLLKGAGRVSLVSIMLANNETGVIQPMAALSKVIHDHGALLHCDATQALGRIPVDMQQLGIDFLTCAAHKVGGPQGVGALAFGLCGITPSLLYGGGQERKARAGTENVAGIAGFHAALDEALEQREAEFDRLQLLQQKLEEGILAVTSDAIVHAQGADRLPNTTFFSLAGKTSESLLMAMDLSGIAVSNGSACSSGTVKQSHVLCSMGVSDDLAKSALRISTGWGTTEDDIDAFLESWDKINA